MIEVEKNFDLKPGDKERLIDGATFIAKKTFTDIYWDTITYTWTSKDYWLRQRDGTWQLKKPLNKEGIDTRTTDQYAELETEAEITRELGVDVEARGGITADLAAALRAAGLFPFATIITNRESYHKGEFHLDFDEMDFGYVTFEAELMVADRSAVSEAGERILAFASQQELTTDKGRGKVIEYLFRYRPEHYAALRVSGVVP